MGWSRGLRVPAKSYFTHNNRPVLLVWAAAETGAKITTLLRGGCSQGKGLDHSPRLPHPPSPGSPHFSPPTSNTESASPRFRSHDPFTHLNITECPEELEKTSLHTLERTRVRQSEDHTAGPSIAFCSTSLRHTTDEVLQELHSCSHPSAAG